MNFRSTRILDTRAMIDKRGPSGNGDSQDRKRARFRNARKIVSENKDAALKDGVMDVPSFTAARQFEIDQLNNAMLKSRNAAKQRAFQSVPRTLRRRTASHNVKRVPQRLRTRAKREMADDNTPNKKAGKQRGYERAAEMRKNRAIEILKASDIAEDWTGVNEEAPRPCGKRTYLKRQKDKVWLPTHVWHAKRAHIENLWGFCVPVTPTQKCYRATHRLITHSGLMVWDSSYFCTYVLSGNVDALRKVATSLGTDVAAAPKYLTGKRSWEGILRADAGRVLGPAVLWWQPNVEGADDSNRSLLVRVHPSIQDVAYAAITSKTASAGITVQDCRYSIGGIKLFGSKALHAVCSVLHATSKEVSCQLESMAAVGNVSALPGEIVMTFNARDPRLCKLTRAKLSTNLSATTFEWTTGPSSLLSVEGRKDSYTNMMSQKEINALKDTTPKAAEIPIAMMKRSDGSLDLLMPWHWVQHVWTVMVKYPGVQLGGYDQLKHIAFEQGTPHFPEDYLFTDAGHDLHLRLGNNLREKWTKLAKSKRPSYRGQITEQGQGEAGNPFICDWSLLNGDKQKSSPTDEEYSVAKDTPRTITLTSEPGKTLVVPVLIESTLRGASRDLARIYSADASISENGLLDDESKVIGFVTSGAFNTARGRGGAIGLIRAPTQGSSGACLVRNVGSSRIIRATYKAIELQGM